MTACLEHDYLKLLENLIRGRLLSKPIEATHMFARQYQKKLQEAQCLGESKEIIIDKLKEAYFLEKLDYRSLSEAINDGIK